MTYRSRIMSLFPLIMVVGILSFAGLLMTEPSFLNLIWVLSFTYLFPPLAYRFHNFVMPLHSGVSNLSSSEYSAWWGGHQIQVIFIALPQLEALLRIIPGVYSWWLRLWGSKIGRNVYWTPSVAIEDRGLMRVGNDVIFGHFFKCTCHIIRPRNDGLILYVREIEIGDRAFLGAGTTLGPGAKVKDSEFLPVLSIRSFGFHAVKEHGEL